MAERARRGGAPGRAGDRFAPPDDPRHPQLHLRACARSCSTAPTLVGRPRRAGRRVPARLRRRRSSSTWPSTRSWRRAADGSRAAAAADRPRGAQQRGPPRSGAGATWIDTAASRTGCSSCASTTTGSASTRRRSARRGHHGLANMRDRAAAIGGQSRHREHAGGHGTTLSIRVPNRRSAEQSLMTDDPDVSTAAAPARRRRPRGRAPGSRRAARPPAGFQVVAEAGTVAEAIEQARRLPAGHRRDGRPAAGRIGHRGLSRDPRGAARDAGRDAHLVPGRGGGPVARSSPAPAAISSSRFGRATWWPRWRRSGAAGRCSTRRSPSRSSSGCAGSPRRMATTSSRADAAGAQDPAARRRGQDQQGDRGRGLPVGQDRQELRQLDPRQAQPGAAGAGRGVRGQAPKSSAAGSDSGPGSARQLRPAEKSGGPAVGEPATILGIEASGSPFGR